MSDGDLFSGPRGWDVGGRPLGLNPIGLELDSSACATSVAAGFLTMRADVRQVPLGPFRGKLRGLIASPPCQTFSSAGNQDDIGHLPAIVAHVHACLNGWCDTDAEWRADPTTGLGEIGETDSPPGPWPWGWRGDVGTSHRGDSYPNRAGGTR